MSSAITTQATPRLRKLRIAWSVGWGVVALLVCALWVRSYWHMDQVIRSVGAANMGGCTSIQGQINLGLTDDANCLTVFPHNRIIHKGFALSDWDKELRGPVAYYPSGAPGRFLTPTIRVPRFTRRPFVTSTPGTKAAELQIPYWLLLLPFPAASALPWLHFHFRLRTLFMLSTAVSLILAYMGYMVRG